MAKIDKEIPIIIFKKTICSVGQVYQFLSMINSIRIRQQHLQEFGANQYFELIFLIFCQMIEKNSKKSKK